ncbi:carbohydrate ABC transporter permease [Actinomadura sp. DC4]|uniref:carbohydrate ABC transporter permease n=1 Tax=Actinomadura sp. DC4 TaxID=3055069 RepID=UPI0025B0224A|nr:carbohydrate ABC transporter permease [Actinomadura sp. DC4]MDN3356745.1 carbohydrate ABC transporter permease [Actinomadura sp. DC4]
MAARTAAREMGRQRRMAAAQHALARVVVYSAAAGAALLCAAPFLWGLVTAFEHDASDSPRERPGPTTEHVRLLFHSTPFATLVVNTLVVGGLVVVVTLVLALPAAYALSRLNRAWGRPAALAILLVALVPSPLLFLSLSRIVATLGLADSFWSLVLVYPTVTVPVSVWLLAGFLRAVPVDLEEQAMVDGHSRLGAFLRVVAPLALPGIAAVVVLTFTLAAGEFTYALTFVWSGSRMPVSTGLPARLGDGDPMLWRSVQTGAVFVAIPLAVVCGLVLDWFVAVLAAGTNRDQPDS